MVVRVISWNVTWSRCLRTVVPRVVASVVGGLVDVDPGRSGDTPWRYAATSERERRFKMQMPSLRLGDSFCQSHSGPEISVLAHDDGCVILVFMGRLHKVKRQADIHALLLAGRVDSSLIDVDVAAVEMPTLVRPEAVPELTCRWSGHSRVEAKVTRVRPGMRATSAFAIFSTS